MKIGQLHTLFLESSGISTDTRKINPESLFFALKGENFDANDFAEEALAKGAAFAVVDKPGLPERPEFIQVDDALKTLQELASFHRKQLNLPVIALTGSNGKTTTKELINAVLSQEFNTVATRGNLNNHIGVPLTLLAMTGDTEIGIVEMGANHLEEIAFLAGIARPDYGYITNFGKAHLEGFGGVEGVIKGKSELYDFLKSTNKTLFLNLNDPIQKKQISYPKTFTFGTDPEADVQVEFPAGMEFATIQAGDVTINSQLTGSYNSKNMAAAYAIGHYFDIPSKAIKKAIENYLPNNNRSQIIEKNSHKIILDAYNANPTSMAAALENFEAISHPKKVAFLGDMFELGVVAEEEHQQLVNKLVESEVQRIYLIGGHFCRTTTTSEERIKRFKTFDDFRTNFNPAEVKNSLILIKGSRGMALERILEFL